jgi:hypothetical protein
MTPLSRSGCGIKTTSNFSNVDVLIFPNIKKAHFKKQQQKNTSKTQEAQC